jgi:hypothetical protein
MVMELNTCNNRVFILGEWKWSEGSIVENDNNVLVRTIESYVSKSAGTQTLYWDGKNDNGIYGEYY